MLFNFAGILTFLKQHLYPLFSLLGLVWYLLFETGLAMAIGFSRLEVLIQQVIAGGT